MKHYFKLQIKLFNRVIKANGINPVFSYLFLSIAFLFISVYVFNHTDRAIYMYPFLPVFFWGWLSKAKRNSFLKTVFTKSDYRKIRWIENCLAAFPFAIFLLFKQQFLVAGTIIIVGTLFSFIEIKKQASFVIPTPFRKYPFEFTTGFRRTYLLILIAYLLSAVGIYVVNFNLSIFGLALVILCCISYYTMPEKKFFVWISSTNTQGFLFHKIKIAFWYSLLLCAPLLFSLLLIFPGRILIILAILCIGLFIIIVSLLGKYAVFPQEINLTQGLTVAFSMLFPPLLLIILPLLYWQSRKRIKPILK